MKYEKRNKRKTGNIMANPAKFIREVRQETSRITWPTRKETMMSTITVLVMVIFASLLFMLVDGVIANIVELVLGL